MDHCDHGNLLPDAVVRRPTHRPNSPDSLRHWGFGWCTNTQLVCAALQHQQYVTSVLANDHQPVAQALVHLLCPWLMRCRGTSPVRRLRLHQDRTPDVEHGGPRVVANCPITVSRSSHRFRWGFKILIAGAGLPALGRANAQL